MSQQKPTIGVALAARTSADALSQIEDLEKMGIPAVWSTTGGIGGDALTFFAAAATRTNNMLMGTSIIPTYPRHPLVVAQQTQVLAHLAPGRFRLGIGPSHQATIESNYGISFKAPLGHLREYLKILKTLFQTGEVNFDGRYYKAHGSIGSPVDIPVMASALRRLSFELCGAEADGAISWVCPGIYLRDVALPAMRKGSEQADRPMPPLIAHTPICVHDDPEDVRSAARNQIGFYPRAPFYASMFTDAGFPEASLGTWSDEMLDSVVLSGNESRVEERLLELLSFGVTEVIVSPITAGENTRESRNRTLNLVASIEKSMSRK